MSIRPDRMMPAVVCSLGFTTMVLQVTALRELLTVFDGNELVIGITLALWLAAAGAGSAAGRLMRSRTVFGAAVLLTGLLAQPLLSLAPFLRTLLSLEQGETVSLLQTFSTTAVLLFPFCFAAGMQYPLAASALEGDAARAYLLEAVGACAGGALTTYVLAGRASSAVILAGLGVLHVALAAIILERKRLLALLLVPFAVLGVFALAREQVLDEDLGLISRTESRYGVIEVYGTADQKNIFTGGKFHYAYPDPPAEELQVHLPFSLHEKAQRVLLIGGSPALVREALKHQVMSVDFVEIDAQLIRVVRALLAPRDLAAIEDRRVHLLTTDGRRYLAGLPGPSYDLVILNLPEPSTANLCRFYTEEFFREAVHALADDGVIALSLPVSFGYVGKRVQQLNGAVLRSLTAVFPHTAVSSEEYGIIAGSARPIAADPATLMARFARVSAQTSAIHPALFDDAFSPMKTSAYRARLEQVVTPNRDARPAAYLFSTLVWADMHRNGLLAHLIERPAAVTGGFLAITAAIGLWLRLRRGAAAFTVLSTGFSSMALCLLVLLAYQSAYGYVYERIGLLTAAFMAGTAAGAWGCRDASRPRQLLRMLEACSLLVIVCAPLLFTREIGFLAAAAGAGTLGGAVFAVAAGGQREAARWTAGSLYGLDLAGSFAGALLVALFFVPVLGVVWTLAVTAAVKALSLLLLLTAGHEQA